VFSRFVATKLRVINHLKTFQQRHRGGKAVPLLFSSDLANITSQEFSISQTKNCGCVEVRQSSHVFEKLREVQAADDL
jgi:hypothetical protein